MTSLANVLGTNFSDHPLRERFLKWQCRVRQMAMRDGHGRPDDAIMPQLILPGHVEPLGHVITVLNKAPGYSVTSEFRHMAGKTNDPAQRRDEAIRFLSATYYQKPAEFSDILTATFPPGSPGARAIRGAASCKLIFEAFNQRFDLACKVWRLAGHNPLYQATIAHNLLFNPALPPATEVLGFEPDWPTSTSARGTA